MKTLERPLHKENSLKLFARNDLVSAYNRKLLINQPGEIYEYKATDTEDRSKLQNVTAQGILWLKENCPIVLIRNIFSTLVNGLQGTVIKCETDGPTVHFPAISSTVKVKKISFSVFSPRQNRTIANTEQIPLPLSYALTINKAQGMTLVSVEVDCREIFQPGQLGVAIGRARSAERLRVIKRRLVFNNHCGRFLPKINVHESSIALGTIHAYINSCETIHFLGTPQHPKTAGTAHMLAH